MHPAEDRKVDSASSEQSALRAPPNQLEMRVVQLVAEPSALLLFLALQFAQVIDLLLFLLLPIHLPIVFHLIDPDSFSRELQVVEQRR